MGERGPTPIPARILELRGSKLAREARTSTVEVPAAAPSPPVHLSGPALAEWERIVPLLERVGLVGEADLALLVVYVEAWERYLAASAALRVGGYVLVEEGRAKISPYHRILERERRALERAARHFGLSPATRRGLASDASGGGEPDESLEAWHKRHGRA